MSRQPRTLAVRSALEQIGDEARCLAAVFFSYTFNPAFFENQVLRALLRLRSDPVEHTTDFLHEATRALQTTPVACFVDAGAREPGQRLPYELHVISTRVFHPKLALIARDDHAHLLLGSGNLTRGGYGDNTELWSTLRLRYDSPEDAALLRELLPAIRDVEALSGHRSAALDELERVISTRLTADTTSTPPTCRLLHSLREPILPAFLQLLPEDATIVQIGVLAPFYERDDADALRPEDVDGVFGEILRSRPSAGAVLDLGFTWMGGPLSPPAAIPAFAERPRTLWVHRVAGDPPTLHYFTPHKWTPQSLRYSDARGTGHTWARAEAEQAWDARAVFPAAPCVANGPQQLVRVLQSHYKLRTWLYPSLRLEAGRPVKRPLHAKLIAIVVTTRDSEVTYLLAGSPNASRRALQIPGAQANVEFALVLALKGRWTLDALAPELVACPPDQLVLTTPDFPASDLPATPWIDLAEYDARTGELRVHWHEQAPAAPYRLVYLDTTVTAGPVPPRGLQVFPEFDLRPTSCELTFEVDSSFIAVPIVVLNLAALQVEPIDTKYDLAALVALLSRRIGAARLRQLVAQRSAADEHPVLAALFGEGFTPTDIFRMFHALARELADPERSLPAFRHVLLRPTGVLAVWQALREAQGEHLSQEQRWFYGSELVRSLVTLTLPDDPDREAKQAELTALVARLRDELAVITPSAADHPWVEEIVRFYA